MMTISGIIWIDRLFLCQSLHKMLLFWNAIHLRYKKASEYHISFHRSTSDCSIIVLLVERVVSDTTVEKTVVKYSSGEISFLIEPSLQKSTTVEFCYQELYDQFIASNKDYIPAPPVCLSTIILIIDSVMKTVNNNLMWEYAKSIFQS